LFLFTGLGEGDLFSTYVSVYLLDDVYYRRAGGYNCVDVLLYVNVYNVINYSSFVYCDGVNRFVSFSVI